MSEPWKPAIQIWPFRDAPEELRRLGGEPEGNEELVIFVPKGLCSLFESGNWPAVMPSAFWFLSKPAKREELLQFAGDGFGDYRLYLLPDGSRVAITESSAEFS